MNSPLDGAINRLISYTERKFFDRHARRGRGTPLTDDEFGRVQDYVQDIRRFEREIYDPLRHKSYRIDSVNWLFDLHDIPGPDGEKWSRP